ncbi:uncharacterized protein LOC105442508 isoform X1 [Strongylocentrotus purpuratus]|uniref:Uncharacterized protein n=1 Tax=Strongylocentrotus purpuratus TaxID=7668 RepID=A0A7M7T526_STRPU|nr:uncharacterized protein LOC105442508 isoform X1 [Strongylocentrotus purpuratus]XP_030854425.1 uncharacterized protein LOC105442508 isoform X1 [Strongylocentrotus purpuratus]
MSIAKPANLNIQQMPDENPYELSPVAFDADDIEMRNHLKFTQLPQDPPVPAPRQRTEETNLSTEQPLSPSYKNPPAYNGRPHHHGHHFYEEVNQSALQRQSNKPSVYGSPNSLPTSHTEVDQAILFQQSTTNSLAQLTESVEKKPRKKTNPLYDSYRNEDDDTLDTRTYPSQSDPVKPKSPGSCIGSVLRHPCTIFLLIAVIITIIVFFVLLLLGTITSKAGETAARTQNESSSEITQLRKQVVDQNTLINSMMQKIERLEMAIINPGNENASLDIRVARNTYMLMTLNESLSESDRELVEVKETAELAHQQAASTISTQVAFLNRITLLENQTQTLDGQVKSLRGSLQTHSMSIVGIENDNQEQDNKITILNSEISVVQQSFMTQFSEYNNSIYQELETISKLQGPRGFNGSDGASGMSDLAQCSYETLNKGSAITQTTTITNAISADGVTEILTGVSCSTLNGERALLRTTGSDPVSFTCECSGAFAAGQTSRYCYIHYWRCPVMA